MDYMRGGSRLLIIALAVLVATSVCAAENDPLPVPVGSPQEEASDFIEMSH